MKKTLILMFRGFLLPGFLLLGFLLLGVFSSFAAAQSILVVGDSLSAAYNIPTEAGWVHLLQRKIAAEIPGDHKVTNASISGDTTAGGLARLPGLLDTFEPDLVVLELGGNDGLRGLSLARMKSNLQAMIDMCRGRGADILIVNVHLPISYGRVFNRRFQEVYQNLAEANDIPLIPFGFQLLNDRDLVQDDGIHPTESAQPLLVDAIWPYFEARLAGGGKS